MAVPPSLLPSHSEKVLGAMKAERTVKRIAFNPTEANPRETLYVSVPKLAENEVIVAGSLALVFNINLKVTGAHANNYLVQNVSRALVDKFVVKFAATMIQDTDSYDIYKTFEDLFLSLNERTKHAFGGHSEFGSVQDSLWRWRQEDKRCGCGKQAE